MDELLDLGYVPSDSYGACQAPGDATPTKLGAAQIETGDRSTECNRSVGTRVCVPTISNYYAAFVYGFSKRGMCIGL